VPEPVQGKRSRRTCDEYLTDALDAATEILDWTRGHSFDVYRDHKMMRRAVEKNLDIIAEALKAAELQDHRLVESIPNIDKIKRYHIIMSHLYFTVDDQLVWDAIQTSLPEFARRLRRRLSGWKD